MSYNTATTVTTPFPITPSFCFSASLCKMTNQLIFTTIYTYNLRVNYHFALSSTTQLRFSYSTAT